jgi:hypothetical protein
MRDVLQISIPPIESRIEKSRCDTSDERVLFSLYFMETIKHATVMPVEFSKVVEHVLQKGGESVPRYDL